LKDVLHPRFGDVHVLSSAHNDDCNYLKSALTSRLVVDPSAVVFYDCGIFWDIPRLRHHSPDISVIFGVQEHKDWKTFDVKIEKVRPTLIIEVTSPKTRVNDTKTKVKQYARARVPCYVIADVVEKNNQRRLRLIAYRLDGEKYVKVPLDEHGRAWLEPLKLWLGVRVHPQTGGARLVLVDPATNQEIPDYNSLEDSLVVQVNARAEAEEWARAEVIARTQAEKSMQAEALARAEAEERARAEVIARTQAEKSMQAGALARAEAKDRARAAEDRVRQLESQLKRRERGKSS
jgi:colicin import membrane protein